MKKTIILVVVAVVLVAGSVLGTLYFTGTLAKPAPTPEAQAAAAQAEPAKKAPTYISLDPAFTVSFHGSTTAQFLQVDIQATTRESDVEGVLDAHQPVVRNGLVMLLSSQKPEELVSREGKERLRGEVLEELRKILTTLTGKPGIDEVFFTSFLIQ